MKITALTPPDKNEAKQSAKPDPGMIPA